MKTKLVIALLCATMLTSCFATRTWVGNYRETTRVEKEDAYTYSKSKQAYLFWGLLPIGHTRVATPADGNCEIRTRHGFVDALVTAITGGLFSVQTIKVNAPKESKASMKRAVKMAEHQHQLQGYNEAQ